MAEALENAYLVLLGQIALILSAIVFGVPFFFSTSDSPHLYQPPTLLFLTFVFAASAMMVVNIIIGWAALRGSLKNPQHYTVKMFVVDILIVLTFFFMNNAILFSFGGTLSLDKVANLKGMLDGGVPLRTVAFLAASLYLLTAIFLLLCKFWNNMYYRASGTTHSRLYEGLLWLIIAFCAVATPIALLKTNSLLTQGALMLGWLGGWIYINGHWLALDFFGPENPQSAPPVGGPTEPPAVEPPGPAAASGLPAAAASSARTPTSETPQPPRTRPSGASRRRTARKKGGS